MKRLSPFNALLKALTIKACRSGPLEIGQRARSRIACQADYPSVPTVRALIHCAHSTCLCTFETLVLFNSSLAPGNGIVLREGLTARKMARTPQNVSSQPVTVFLGVAKRSPLSPKPHDDLGKYVASHVEGKKLHTRGQTNFRRKMRI